MYVYGEPCSMKPGLRRWVALGRVCTVVLGVCTWSASARADSSEPSDTGVMLSVGSDFDLPLLGGAELERPTRPGLWVQMGLFSGTPGAGGGRGYGEVFLRHAIRRVHWENYVGTKHEALRHDSGLGFAIMANQGPVALGGELTVELRYTDMSGVLDGYFAEVNPRYRLGPRARWHPNEHLGVNISALLSGFVVPMGPHASDLSVDIGAGLDGVFR